MFDTERTRKLALEYAAIHGAFNAAEIAPLVMGSEAAVKHILDDLAAKGRLVKSGDDYDLPRKKEMSPRQRQLGVFDSCLYQTECEV